MMNSPTVDPEEVAYYDRLADQWWDRDGKFWPLHRLNELRCEYLKQETCRHYGLDSTKAQPLEGLRAIDIGCGGGILAESIAALGAEVHAIDVVEKNIRVARQHNLTRWLPIEYELATVEEIAASGRRYDIVFNMEVVEHVADLAQFMSGCCRLLADDGIMFVATINRNLLSWLVAIVGAEYVLGWLPRGTHQWSRFVTPRECEVLLARAGLEVTARSGVRVNPFTRRMTLTPSLAVNYMLLAHRTGADDGEVEA